MDKPLLIAGLALATCISAGAAAADMTGPARTTVSVLAGGKEVATIVLPPSASRPLIIKADHIVPSGESVHATGHVRVTLGRPGASQLLIGDELVLTKTSVSADEARAVADLEAMSESDQSIRGKQGRMSADDWARQTAIDNANTARLVEIIDRYGWPGLRFAGQKGSDSAWLVLQHSEPDVQKKYLPLMRVAVARNDADPGQLAMLEDRVRMRDGRAQLYGSQLQGDPPKLYPIEDEEHVDQRRQSVGLPPLAEYLKHFGITYQPPKHQAAAARDD